VKQIDFSALAHVNPNTNDMSAVIREQPEYFRVNEILPFTPDGTGGHVWLNIQKRGINTDWLATELAKFAKVPPVAIGYAGLKDRHAVTTQWFSINMEGVEHPNWSEFETDDIKIIEKTAHNKKLKRGVLSGNTFGLTLTQLTGEPERWSTALGHIQEHGVPNYFGDQRFGHEGNNLKQADTWFSGGKAPKKRNQKSMTISAARSWLFNLVLSERIKQKNWNQALLGDVMALSGTKSSSFLCEQVDASVLQRIQEMDIHPTGPLWGRGRNPSQFEAADIEIHTLSDWIDWQAGLERVGLSQERRSLRLALKDLKWTFTDDTKLYIEFFLPSGSYATAVLRELAEIQDAQHRNYHKSDTSN
jgi:tRNA pseudouridine13 synthase